MSIELLKELEDLKQVEKELSSQLGKKIDAKSRQYIKNALVDFEKFFVEKGFQITPGPSNISASYGSLKAQLKHSDPSVPYVGTYIRFDLCLQLPQKAEYIIALNQRGKKSGISVSFSSGTKLDPKSQLQMDIERLKEEIEKFKTRIADFQNEEWVFYLRNGDKSINPFSGEAFDSIYDLLTSLTK